MTERESKIVKEMIAAAWARNERLVEILALRLELAAEAAGEKRTCK